MNILASIMPDALQAGRQAYADQQARFDHQTRRSAGRALASGDHAGAASELYGAGMLDAGAGVEKMQTDAEDRRLGLEKDQRALDRQKLKDTYEALGRFADALSMIGEDDSPDVLQQRFATLQQGKSALYPLLTPDVQAAIDRLTPEQLTRAALIAYGADAKNQQMKLFNTARGVVGVRNGKAEVLYQDPYYDRKQEAALGLTEARTDQSHAAAERSRRPPAPRGGGGKGGGGASGLPSGFSLD